MKNIFNTIAFFLFLYLPAFSQSEVAMSYKGHKLTIDDVIKEASSFLGPIKREDVYTNPFARLSLYTWITNKLSEKYEVNGREMKTFYEFIMRELSGKAADKFINEAEMHIRIYYYYKEIYEKFGGEVYDSKMSVTPTEALYKEISNLVKSGEIRIHPKLKKKFLAELKKDITRERFYPSLDREGISTFEKPFWEDSY